MVISVAIILQMQVTDYGTFNNMLTIKYILFRVLRGHIIGSCPKNRLLGELRLLVFIVFERLGLLIPDQKVGSG
jgi:hypothetical protein